MTILDRIVAQTQRDLAQRDLAREQANLHAEIRDLPPPPDFARALRRPEHGSPRIIAELKKASPSKGLIRADFAPESLAPELEAAGAAALSVLTEPHFFQGGAHILRQAAQHVSIPILRKDFIVADIQLLEARRWGAAAVLLIAAVLDSDSYRHLLAKAEELNLAVLTEVHNQEELARVLEDGARIVGVNSRDLTTFRVDLGVTERLLAHIPDDRVRVAESGIREATDMRTLMEAGADAFLIGETFMRAPSPGHALRTLLARVADQAGDSAP